MNRAIHVVPTINNEASGPSYSVTRLCSSLQNRGYETRLAVLEPLPDMADLDFAACFPYGIGPKRLGNSPEMKRWLRREVQAGRFQIVHNHSLWMMPNIYPASAVNGTSCKLVVSPRGTLSRWALRHSAMRKKVLWLLGQKRVLEDAAGFHVTAESEYEDIRRLGFNQPVAILPNGVDIPELKEKSPGDSRTLLFVGRIHPIKGIDNLLKAWALVHKQYAEWNLKIVGPDNGGYLDEMERLAGELGLKRCKFFGPLYGDAKQQAYAQADLYVLPTHSENFGMTVAEALAAGTPAMVTRGAPWQELEKEGAGWWIDIGIDPLVAGLEKALASPPESLREMGQNGRDWMLRDFSWKKIAADMAVFYDWLIQGGTVPDFVRVD